MRPWVFCLIALVGTAGCDIRVGDEGVSVGLSSGRADDEWVRTYTLPESGTLEVVNINGPIEVAGAPGPETQVHVYREATSSSDEAARAALETLKIVETVEPSRVSVAATHAPDAPRAGRRTRLSSRFNVRVSPGLASTFRTQNGQIRLEYVSGRVTATVANGGIQASGLAGGVHVSAGNGSVRVDMIALEHPSEITVLNGSVRLELPADVRATLEASSLNGRITVDEAFGIAPVSGGFGPGSRAVGEINGGGPAIVLQTTNGAIRVAVRGSRAGRTGR